MSAPANAIACSHRLALLIPRLGSNHDGEVINTVAAMKRLLASEGRDLHDLAGLIIRNQPAVSAPRPAYTAMDWHAQIRWLQARAELLTEWERSFLASIAQLRRLSEKQQQCLDRILAKVRSAGNA